MTTKSSFLSILFSGHHLFHPTSYENASSNGLITTHSISIKTRITAIVLGIVFALPTLGVGSLALMYLITACSKSNALKAHKKVDSAVSSLFPKLKKKDQPAFTSIPKDLVPAALQNPPKNGIRIGLNNVGNTCWLNSLLKCLAATTYFDKILLQNSPDLRKIVAARNPNASEDVINDELERLVNLRDHLRFIIQALRTPVTEDTLLNPKCITSLMKLLQSFNPDLGYLQCDSMEGLQLITSLFDAEASANNNVLKVTQNFNHPTLIRAPIVEGACIIAANVHALELNRNDKINLNDCLNGAGTELLEIKNDNGEKEVFEVRSRVTHTPENFVIHVARNHIQYTNQKCVYHKHSNKVDFDENFRVKIKSYEHKGKGVFAKKAQHTYEITGAIIHAGSSTGGHYTFVEKKGDIFIYHNDSNVYEISATTARSYLEKACTFQLRKVLKSLKAPSA